MEKSAKKQKSTDTGQHFTSLYSLANYAQKRHLSKEPYGVAGHVLHCIACSVYSLLIGSCNKLFWEFYRRELWKPKGPWILHHETAGVFLPRAHK